MSLRYPTTTVKLPFNAPQLATSPRGKRTYTTSQIEQTICGICGKKQSKYVCPRCNVFYCSLDCFRDEKHAQCSEPFYASAVREAIQSDSASSSDEKRKMMEMLNRFERGDTEGSSGEGSTMNGIEELLRGMGGISEDDKGRNVEDDNGDGDEDEFEALEALRAQLSDDASLENMDMQDLVNLLPPMHRDQFLSLLSNPDPDHVQRLLDSVDESDRNEVESASSPGVLLARQQTEEVEVGDRAASEIRTTSIPESAPAVVPHSVGVSECRDSQLPRARIEEL